MSFSLNPLERNLSITAANAPPSGWGWESRALKVVCISEGASEWAEARDWEKCFYGDWAHPFGRLLQRVTENFCKKGWNASSKDLYLVVITLHFKILFKWLKYLNRKKQKQTPTCLHSASIFGQIFFVVYLIFAHFRPLFEAKILLSCYTSYTKLNMNALRRFTLRSSTLMLHCINIMLGDYILFWIW